MSFDEVGLFAFPASGDGGQSARVRRLRQAVDRELGRSVRWWDAFPVLLDRVTRVHDAAYVARLEALRGRMARVYEHRTILPGSMMAIQLAAGTVLDAVEAVHAGLVRRAFCVSDPPGHHAEAGRGMGFCALNNVAIAVRHAQAELGLRRILILDWDVHHGNGTQHLLEHDPDVLFCDVHQAPLFPGSGAADETGLGPGAGRTLNVPLPAGRTDDDYLAVFDRAFAPAARRFEPELIVISCGFDAHADDPLGGMTLTDAAYGALTDRVVALADALCGGRVVMALEGGYHAEAVARSAVRVLRALAGEALLVDAGDPSPETGAVLEALEAAHPLLAAAPRAHAAGA